ncbi:hypothetical protein NEOLEDRAFT_1139614 [Neolentinus lepideus HHB14362 ss-1]|uniref:Uncharacterized protein n=1 Tax=Neolentinus lepideus HHB14362 ss-1 TaxID=1314782 RepID=A0A165PNM7_9AGAM|nr:hypothetical protein NEOLEDRAFT_1139614 [Neolentinus lepideus HHB14362 ss-1]
MSKYHLRPVSDTSPSASPSPPRDHSSPPSGSNTAKSSATLPSQPSSATSTISAIPSNPRPRRPLSPSSIRDVDLTSTGTMTPRVYPPPPTGHELMSLFPPPPPPFMESTSGYFQRQERAFFAQKGKEIICVRFELDLERDGMDAMDVDQEPEGKGKEKERYVQQVHLQPPRENPTIPRPWPAPQPQLGLRQSPPAPYPRPHLSRPSPRVATIPTTPSYTNGPPPNLHPPRAFAQEVTVLPVQSQQHATPPMQVQVAPVHSSPRQHGEPSHDDPDESWRRPIPHNERRRAGKHTKRVIVK